MESGAAREVLLFGAYATIFALVGVLSLVAAFRWLNARRTGVFLAAAMLLHTLTLLGGTASTRAALGGPPIVWDWIATIGMYSIGLFWALLIEEIVGPGWKSSIRRTWQVFAVYAAAATLFDVAIGKPGGLLGAWQASVVGTGAGVALLNLFWSGIRIQPEIRVLRAGYSVFMVVVIHDMLVSVGMAPWMWRFGQIGVLTFVACLVYTIVSRTLRGQSQLHAIEHELSTAHRIQQSLLPREAPPLDDAAIAFRHVPAASVAGDLFQFLDAGPRRVGILLADVSGHGVPAALIASMVKMAAAAQSGHADDPARVLGGIYQAIAAELPPGQFVTAVYVYLDLDRHLLRHAAAGHPPALIRRMAGGCVIPAGAAGPLIMSIAPPDYPVCVAHLEPGDRVVLYTDGIVEAMRGDGEMFGADRLSALTAITPEGPEGFVAAAVAAASAFSGRLDGTFEDDCTMVTLEIASIAARRFPMPVATSVRGEAV